MEMSKPSETPGFKALLDEWNKKLLSSGFKDIETMDNGEPILKRFDSYSRDKNLNTITRETDIEYYERVAQLISKTEFNNEQERQIMVLYSEGISQVEIRRILNIEGHRCKVYNPLYKWLTLWGLK